MFATKKITPGGHWIGITSIVTQKANLNMIETIAAYAKVSIGLFDAFIACWDEKWRSILIRPETVISDIPKKIKCSIHEISDLKEFPKNLSVEDILIIS